MTIPSIRSIATVSLDAAWEGDSRTEFKLIKAECVQLCYRALEHLSGFSVPDSVPVDKITSDYKSSVRFKIEIKTYDFCSDFPVTDWNLVEWAGNRFCRCWKPCL